MIQYASGVIKIEFMKPSDILFLRSNSNLLKLYYIEKYMKNINELLNFGVINLDKPSGPTSFYVSNYVRKILNLNKTSHMGTLDPQVSGVLPILLGRACRLSDYFMHKDKEYVGIMRLHRETEPEELKKIISKFIGEIIQLPPVRSRVKRAERVREVKSFEILQIDGKDILFKTEVQAGTYIRKLIHDIGEKIGGAHMLELRRTCASIFKESDSNFITLQELEKAIEENYLERYLVPAEEAIKKVLPFYQISEKNLKKILTGKPLTKADFLKEVPKEKEEKFAAFAKEKFIGVYKKVNEGEIVARAEFVFN